MIAPAAGHTERLTITDIIGKAGRSAAFPYTTGPAKA